MPWSWTHAPGPSRAKVWLWWCQGGAPGVGEAVEGSSLRGRGAPLPLSLRTKRKHEEKMRRLARPRRPEQGGVWTRLPEPRGARTRLRAPRAPPVAWDTAASSRGWPRAHRASTGRPWLRARPPGQASSRWGAPAMTQAPPPEATTAPGPPVVVGGGAGVEKRPRKTVAPEPLQVSVPSASTRRGRRVPTGSVRVPGRERGPTPRRPARGRGDLSKPRAGGRGRGQGRADPPPVASLPPRCELLAGEGDEGASGSRQLRPLRAPCLGCVWAREERRNVGLGSTQVQAPTHPGVCPEHPGDSGVPGPGSRGCPPGPEPLPDQEKPAARRVRLFQEENTGADADCTWRHGPLPCTLGG